MNVVTDTIRNGVDTEKLFATLDLIKAQPELAKFRFRATNRWIDVALNRSMIKDFYAAGGEDTTRDEAFEIDAGEPAILLGTDTGAIPAGADRFAALEWEPGPSGVPLLTGALATLECEIVAEHPAGDHWIVVGRADDLRTSQVKDPLVFFAGAFGGLQ